jgi:hypothetical protein
MSPFIQLVIESRIEDVPFLIEGASSFVWILSISLLLNALLLFLKV